MYQRALIIRERFIESDHQKTIETRTKYTELLRIRSQEEETVGREIICPKQEKRPT
ncbi:MAG TPA: hypothetical protein VFV38_52540 [Ktedonobacteraceae bacterium]|nr:hypothetical protein [Ktedonobacteraceae bacterium]